MSDNTELVKELLVKTIDALEATTVQLAAAQAVIAEARDFASTDAYRGDDGVVDGDEVLRILSQSPVDALAAHDRQVAAKAWDEGYDQGGMDASSDAGYRMAGKNVTTITPNPYRSTVKGEGN